VKLEQAPKVKSWMPTRLLTGEGRANGEESDTHLFSPPAMTTINLTSTANWTGFLAPRLGHRSQWRQRLHQLGLHRRAQSSVSQAAAAF
jgi:hypothetical protein